MIVSLAYNNHIIPSHVQQITTAVGTVLLNEPKKKHI
jgi:hypothetical protein